MAGAVGNLVGFTLVSFGGSFVYLGWKIHEAIIVLIGALFGLMLAIPAAFLLDPHLAWMGGEIRGIFLFYSILISPVLGGGIAYVLERVFIVVQGGVVGTGTASIIFALLPGPDHVLLMDPLVYLIGKGFGHCVEGSEIPPPFTVSPSEFALFCFSFTALIISIIVGVVAAWLAWKFYKYGIIAATAFYGTIFVLLGLIVASTVNV